MFSKNHPQSRHLIAFVNPGATLPNLLTQEQFREKMKIHYLPHLNFESEKVFKSVVQESGRLVKKKTVGMEAKWNGALYKEELNVGFVNEIAIKWVSNEVGHGVFAEKTFRVGEYIGEYTGVVRPYGLFSGRLNPYCFRYPTYNIWFHVHFIDALENGNETRFINHSDTPNCEAIIAFHDELLHICIRTCKKIPKGTELTFDYGNAWWGERSKFT